MQFWTIDPVPLGPAFNSLFEMLRALGRRRRYWKYSLSILYLRCREEVEPQKVRGEVELSILYLRCGASNMDANICCSATKAFNSLFEMRRGTTKAA